MLAWKNIEVFDATPFHCLLSIALSLAPFRINSYLLAAFVGCFALFNSISFVTLFYLHRSPYPLAVPCIDCVVSSLNPFFLSLFVCFWWLVSSSSFNVHLWLEENTLRHINDNYFANGIPFRRSTEKQRIAKKQATSSIRCTYRKDRRIKAIFLYFQPNRVSTTVFTIVKTLTSESASVYIRLPLAHTFRFNYPKLNQHHANQFVRSDKKDFFATPAARAHSGDRRK